MGIKDFLRGAWDDAADSPHSGAMGDHANVVSENIAKKFLSNVAVRPFTNLYESVVGPIREKKAAAAEEASKITRPFHVVKEATEKVGDTVQNIKDAPARLTQAAKDAARQAPKKVVQRATKPVEIERASRRGTEQVRVSVTGTVENDSKNVEIWFSDLGWPVNAPARQVAVHGRDMTAVIQCDDPRTPGIVEQYLTVKILNFDEPEKAVLTVIQRH